MRSLVLWSAMATLVIARPDLYKEKEDFHYSRSSSDEGTRSGYYDAQRGNMGGNYERAHNMDTLAQHQMGGLVKQVEGELGDGSNTRTGSVFSSANSRGVYGSGHFDLSNLQGRNFQEGVTYGNSQLHSSSQSEYDAHSTSHGNARYSSSHNSGDSNYRRHQTSNIKDSGDSNYRRYQTSTIKDSGESNYRGYLTSNVKDAQTLYGQNLLEQGQQIGSNSKYSQSGHQGSNIYLQSQINTDEATQNLDTNIHHRLISTVPVKIIVRPGQRIAIPIAIQTQQGAHVASHYDQNVANTQTEILNSNGLQENFKPSGAGKHYESSYSYHKEWEKHDTQPYINTDSKNSELYDNSQRRYSSQHDNKYEQNRDQTAALSQSRYQADFNAQHQQTSSNSNLNALSQSGTVGDINSHSANLVGTVSSNPKSYQSSYSYHKSWERQGEPYVIKSATNAINEGQTSGRLTDLSATSQNHGYDCMYECRSRHSRVARSYGGYTPIEQHSQKFEDLGQQTQTHWGDFGQETQNTFGNIENLGQHTETSSETDGQQAQNLDVFSQQSQSNLENFGQQTQNTFDKIEDFRRPQKDVENYENIGQESQNTFEKIEDLGQETQTAWDKTANVGQETQNLEDFSQQSQSNLYNFESLGQQTQHTFDKIEDLGQQSQTAWDKTANVGQETQNLENFSQQSQSNLYNFESLGQQTQHTFDKIEDLGQQSQTAWDKTANVGQETQNLENFSQQSQSNLYNFENLGQQTQHTFDKIEDLGQQTQTAWDKTANVGQETQNLEDFSQQSQSNLYNFESLGQQTQHTFDKIEDLGQQTQHTFDKIEDIGQQTQLTFDKIEDLGQQTQHTFDKIEDLGQQTQTVWDKTTNVGQETQNLEDFSQQSQSNLYNFESLGQQTQHTLDKIEDLGQQTQTVWDKTTSVGQETQNLEDFSQQSQSNLENFEILGQQTQNTFNKIEDLGQQTQTAWDKTTNVGQNPKNLEDFSQQSQSNLENFESLGQQTQHTFDKIEDLWQQTQTALDKTASVDQETKNLEDFSQQSQSNIYDFESVGQHTQNTFDKIEDLGQQTQDQWKIFETEKQPKITPKYNQMDDGQRTQDIWTKLEKTEPTPLTVNEDSSHLTENKWTETVNGNKKQDEHYNNNQKSNKNQDIEPIETNRGPTSSIWNKIDNSGFGNGEENVGQMSVEQSHIQYETATQKTQFEGNLDNIQQMHTSTHQSHNIWDKIDNFQVGKDLNTYEEQTRNQKEEAFERTDETKMNVEQKIMIGKEHIFKLQPNNIGRGDISDEDVHATGNGYHIIHETGKKYNHNINNQKINEFEENQGISQEKFDQQSNMEQHSNWNLDEQENNHFDGDMRKHLNNLEKGSTEQQNNWRTYQKEISGMDKFSNTEQQSISNLEQQNFKSYFLEDFHQKNQENINQEFINHGQQPESQGYKRKESEFVEFVPPELITVKGAAYNNERKTIPSIDENFEVVHKKINHNEMTIINENHQHSYITTTQKPSFWKRVGNKFQNAKEKVSSWFES